MLHDHAGGVGELGDQAPGRVQIEDVVERELLALQLARGGHRIQRRAEVAVERGALVRVLAVAQVLHLLEGEGKAVREHLFRLRDSVGIALGLHAGFDLPVRTHGKAVGFQRDTALDLTIYIEVFTSCQIALDDNRFADLR